MYDWKCYELAAIFLEDEPALNSEANRRSLAAEIQETIEDFMENAAGRSGETARTGSQGDGPK